MKIALVFLMVIHGLIHLMGWVKAFGLAQVEALKIPIGKGAGMLWLLAALVLIIAAVLLALNVGWWWMAASAGLVLSQILIIASWGDASFGSIANLLLVIAVLPAAGKYFFDQATQRETAYLETLQPATETVASERKLPDVVTRWLRATGETEREPIRHVSLQQNFEMKLSPDQENWYVGTAKQEVWTTEPAFVWALDLSMAGFLPVAGRDKYADGKGEMLIKILALAPVVNASNNPKIDEGAQQRYLAEMLWYPSLARSEFLTWTEADENSATAEMNHGGTTGSCTFYFDNTGLVNRVTAMRYRGGDDDAERSEWVIDVLENKTFDGLTIPSKCHVTWKMDSGDWTWARLEITGFEAR